MLIASMRFSANPAKSANATARTPHSAVKRRATRTLRASSAAASGRKWRQKSIVVVVPRAASSEAVADSAAANITAAPSPKATELRSEEHTSEPQSHLNLVCPLLLDQKSVSKST